jgi:hypothetical protein
MTSLELAEVIDFTLGAVAILCLLPSIVSVWRRSRGRAAATRRDKRR